MTVFRRALAGGRVAAAALPTARTRWLLNRRAGTEFIERHLAHWIRPLAHLARKADGDCYADLLDSLSKIESAA